MTSTVPERQTDSDARIAKLEARLAILSEVSEALARELDFQGIVDAVGDRVATLMHTHNLAIGILDPDGKQISFPYWYDEGRRDYEVRPLEYGKGLSSQIIETGKPIRTGTVAEADAQGAVWQGAIDPSYLGVPIRVGDRVIGVVSAADAQENRYTPADEQLLLTIAQSMGVALENARLFDETKQRNAELAVINEIGEALSKQLDFQAVVEAVGDKIQEIFKVDSFGVHLWDASSNVLSTPYGVDQGKRLEVPPPPYELTKGLAYEVISARRPLRLGTEEEATEHGALVYGSDEGESWLGVPILAGERVLGVINVERNPKNAFSESDERLLSTIA